MLFSLWLLLFSVPTTFGDLSVKDLEKISAMFEKSEQRLSAETTASETHTKEYISQEFGKVGVKIDEMDKQLNQIFMLVVALIAPLGVVIGVTQILVALQMTSPLRARC